jgi:asparagine N-glycosylation enzyme membrane subunit Stt3
MKWAGWLVAAVCIVVFALRLYIAFSTDGFSSDDAYFNLRQIENIRNKGLPLYNDPLSWGGRHYVFSPVFHYAVAAGALILPVNIAAKVMPNLFAVLLIPVIFLIARRIAKKEGVALFTAIFSAFVPVWFGYTINTVSPITLTMLLLFFVIYSSMRIQEQKWRYLYLAGLIVLSFTHPLALLFVLGLVFYLILVLVEQLKVERAEIEIALFSVFFVLWSQFLIYKNFIIAHGPAVIWQNIPAALLSSQFAEITVLYAIYQIGILPVLYGVFVIYRYLFRRKHKMTYFLIAFTLAAAVLLWFRLIPIRLGMMLLGMFLIVLFSRWVGFFLTYVPTTRFQRIVPLLVTMLVLAFVLTGFLPSWYAGWFVQSQTPSPAEAGAYEWIRVQTSADSTVVTYVNEGHKVAELAKRKNVIDSHFIEQKDAKQRLHDTDRIFSTVLGVEAAELMERYDANVILLSPETKEKFRISTLRYAERSKCFSQTFSEGGYVVFVKMPYCKVGVVE